jgi:hypothetical protein
MKGENLIFKKGAQRILFRFLLSCCHPLITMTESRKKHERWLASFVREDKDIVLGDYLRGFGEIPALYEKIIETARVFQAESIDENVVCGYFGSDIHLKKVMRDLNGSDVASHMAKCAIKKFLCLHMLGDAEVESIETVDGRLSLTGICHGVRVSELAVFKEDEDKIRVGGHVLFHFATVINPCPSDNFRDILSSERRKCEEFLKIVGSLKGQKISNNGLFHLTDKAMNEYGL